MEIDYKGAGEAGSTGDHPLGRDRLWQQVRPDEIYIDHLRTTRSLRLRKCPGAEHGSRFESATGRTGEETLEKMTGQEWVGWRAGWTCIRHAHWKSKQLSQAGDWYSEFRGETVQSWEPRRTDSVWSCERHARAHVMMKWALWLVLEVGTVVPSLLFSVLRRGLPL